MMDEPRHGPWLPTRVIFLIALLCWSSVPAAADTEADRALAEVEHANGELLFEERNWEAAAAAFHRSYNLSKDSASAYGAAESYYNFAFIEPRVGTVLAARDMAILALNVEPALDEPFAGWAGQFVRQTGDALANAQGGRPRLVRLTLRSFDDDPMVPPRGLLPSELFVEPETGGGVQQGRLRFRLNRPAPNLSPAVPSVPRARLAEVTPNFPADGREFSQLPRALTVSWLLIDDAARYLVEIQHCPAQGGAADECTTAFEDFIQQFVARTNLSFQFPGPGTGRWRVVATASDGTVGPVMEWREFHFLR